MIPKMGRYEIQDEIGKGGMGVVYRALDPAIGRIVAIKTLYVAEGDSTAAQASKARLVRESQAAGRLSHPNIVGVYDIGDEGDITFIVMEYISGRTLEQALTDDAWQRSNETTLRILDACARALDYAHSQGVVHRDVKPANIMLQSGGTVKLADFGIAKVLQSSTLTATATLVGTPHYMAPEQLKGQEVTARTDQYALGAVAYTMLTGRRPFESDTMATLVTQTLFQDPPPAPGLNPALGPAVDGVLRKALAKDAGARYETCSQFIEALQRACAAVPIPSRKRRWIPLAAGGALLLALAIAAFYLYVKGHGESAPAQKVQVAKSAPVPATVLSVAPPITPSVAPSVAPPPVVKPTPVPTKAAAAKETVVPEPCSKDFALTPADQFQTCMDYWSQHGNSVATLTAFDESGAAFIIASFQPLGNRKVTLFTPIRNILDEVGKMTGEGYRPEAVSMLRRGPALLCSVIWVPRNAPFEFRPALTTDKFDAMRQAHKDDGFALTDLVPHRVGGELRDCALWVKRPGSTTALAELKEAELVDHIRTMEQQGFRIDRVTPYPSGSGRRYAAVWEQARGEAMFDLKLTRDALKERTAEAVSKGFRLHHVSAVNGEFCAVWWK